MISFTKPTNLNGIELRDELNAGGVAISDSPDVMVVDGNGNLLLDISESDTAKATPIVAVHNGTTIAPEPTVADKLASLGLNLNDLKAALGLA
jgi:hypothetical protein